MPNPSPWPARVPKFTEKTIEFTGAAGLGAIGLVPVFTVTGAVFITFLGCKCTTSLTGATATVSLGVAGNVAELIALTTATDIDANDVWRNATPDVGAGPAIINQQVVLSIAIDVLTAAVATGVLTFGCYWHPMISTGSLS